MAHCCKGECAPEEPPSGAGLWEGLGESWPAGDDPKAGLQNGFLISLKSKGKVVTGYINAFYFGGSTKVAPIHMSQGGGLAVLWHLNLFVSVLFETDAA